MIAAYAAAERGAQKAAREGAAIVVVDAFRASTAIAVLVRKGARVIPVASIGEVVAYTGPIIASGSAAARKCGASTSVTRRPISKRRNGHRARRSC